MKSIFIYGAITSKMAEAAVKQIKAETESIDIHINSPGGDVYAGLSIFNSLQAKKDIVRTFIDGLAYSAASWIAISAKPENRFMSKASQFGIHQAMIMQGGSNKEELKGSIERLAAIDKIQEEIYTANTGLTAAQVKDIMKADKPLSFNEAKEFGFREFEAEKIAALFNYTNMDFEKITAFLKGEGKSPSHEEVEKETQAAFDKAEDVKGQMDALYTSNTDFEAYKKSMEDFVSLIVDKWNSLPSKEDIDSLVEAKTKLAVAELASNIKTKGIAPTADDFINDQNVTAKQESYEPLTIGGDKSIHEILKEVQK